MVVGRLVGAVGRRDGRADGWREGRVDGELVVGLHVGDDGTKVGRDDGLTVGTKLGRDEGESVGVLVGEIVGIP
jgi:hypothetical protein